MTGQKMVFPQHSFSRIFLFLCVPPLLGKSGQKGWFPPFPPPPPFFLDSNSFLFVKWEAGDCATPLPPAFDYLREGKILIKKKKERVGCQHTHSLQTAQI